MFSTLLPRLLLALLLATGVAAPSLAAPPAPAAIDPAAVPPRQQAPNDESAYRRFVLPNGMKVLLLSDPKLNLSSASVAVGVGSLMDPPARPGLAHYLEHMLFLGTEKYPSESEYGEYLRRNGGYANAWTARDRTNYHLEVQPAAFEGALDRFSQFFIAPLFDPRFSEREVNAVNSEYQKNLEQDFWRQFSVANALIRPGHPAHHFHIGSRETLTGTTREELLAFHDAYYSANRMTLALTGPESLDRLEQWARRYFEPVVDKQRPELHYPADYLPPEAALRLVRIEPVKDLRSLNLSFPMPDLRAYAGSKPAELIGYVLGNEGPGSLLAALKAEGLATGLGAGGDVETHDYGSFEMQIALTPEGLKAYPRVLQMTFAAIDFLRRNGIPPHLFAERRAMAALDERYRDKGEGASLAVSLANAAMDYPLAVAERVPYLWIEEDPAAIQFVLDRMRPDNLMATLVAKGLPTDKVEKYFGAHYSFTQDTGPAYQALLNPPPVASLKLMPPNRYVPDRTQQLPVEAVRLIDEPALSLYYAQDVEFQRPLVSHELRFVLPREMASLRNAVLLDFYAACVNEALNETTYAAYEAGYRTQLAASLEGVRLHVDGYDASATRLLGELAAGLRDCALPEERFAALKDRLLRGLSAFDTVDAWQTLTETRRRVVREFHFRPDERLPVARGVTLQDVQAFARGLFAQGKLEALSHGNLSADEARAAVRQVAQALGAQPLAADNLLRRRLLAMSPGEKLLTSEPLKVNNSAYRRELMLGGDTPEMRAATMVLAAFIGPPTYSELRTRQQLGYIVFGGAGAEDHTQFAYFIVQSGDYPADVLQARTDAFIATLPAQLQALPDDGWQTIVAGVRTKLLEMDKSVAERAARLNDLAYDEGADWARRDATLAALDRLTRDRVAAILAQAVAPETMMSRSFLGFARDHKAQDDPAVSFGDAAAWKAGQRYVR